MALKVSLVKGDWRNESQWVHCSKNLSLLHDAIDNYDADVNETDDLGRTPLMLASLTPPTKVSSRCSCKRARRRVRPPW